MDSSLKTFPVICQDGSRQGSALEWRLNERLLKITKRHYWDLYRNNEYEHAWIAHSPVDNKYHIGSATVGAQIGVFDSFEEAEKALVVLSVIKRFKEAA